MSLSNSGFKVVTLVLACCTESHIYQISDRRLTTLGDPGQVIDDEQNKSVMVNGRVVFSYTGVSQIGGEKTDVWLTRTIANTPNDDMAQVARNIADRATSDFRRYGIRRHHAFQGVGWFRLKNETWISPGVITVDNGIDPRTGSWMDDILPAFRVSTQFPSKLPAGSYLTSVGVSPSADEKATIVRLMRKCVRHKNSTPATVAKALILSMRWLSSRHQAVGPGLVLVALPMAYADNYAETRRSMMYLGPPHESVPAFMYVSATGRRSYFGPHLVTGGAYVTGVEAGSL